MKYHYPKNVILDVKNSNVATANDYWVVSYSSSFNKNLYYATSLNLISSQKTLSNRVLKRAAMETVSVSAPNSYFQTPTKPYVELTAKAKKLRTLKVGSAVDWTFTRYHDSKMVQDGVTTSSFLSAQSVVSETTPHRSRSVLNHLFDINFIKKERLYTKLKYSRSPAYDIVSGGAAALLAGFIGFLVSEKFGIELVDSGDFYIVFMYAIFLALPCRLLLRMMSQSSSLWSIVSPNYLLFYVSEIFRLLLAFFVQGFVTLKSKLQSILVDFGFSWTLTTPILLLLFFGVLFL